MFWGELMVIWKGWFETVPCRVTLNTPLSALCPRLLGTRFTNYGLRVSGNLVVSNSVVCNFYEETFFCVLLRPLALAVSCTCVWFFSFICVFQGLKRPRLGISYPWNDWQRNPQPSWAFLWTFSCTVPCALSWPTACFKFIFFALELFLFCKVLFQTLSQITL